MKKVSQRGLQFVLLKTTNELASTKPTTALTDLLSYRLDGNMKTSVTTTVQFESVQSSTQQNFFSKINFGIFFTFYYPFPQVVTLQEFSNQTLRKASRETKYLIEPTILNLFCNKKRKFVLFLVSSGLL
jgi:hypothetical protein